MSDAIIFNLNSIHHTAQRIKKIVEPSWFFLVMWMVIRMRMSVSMFVSVIDGFHLYIPWVNAIKKKGSWGLGIGHRALGLDSLLPFGYAHGKPTPYSLLPFFTL